MSVIVVTGAASGIGRHMAGALARRGHQVVATDLDLGKLEAEAKANGWAGVRVCALDVRNEDDWEAALDLAGKAFGPVDVLFNIAGYLKPGYVVDFTVRDLELHLDVNVKGVVLGTRAAARRMVPAGKGHIVNFGSLASLAPVPGLGLYSASKFAVRGFSLAAATELAPKGVAVTLVMPDAVQTPMLDLQLGYDEAALTFSGDAPLTVEDIERVIVDRVLPARPMELTIPLSRGALARLANTVPELSKRLLPMLKGKGRKNQARIKSGRS